MGAHREPDAALVTFFCDRASTASGDAVDLHAGAVAGGDDRQKMRASLDNCLASLLSAMEGGTIDCCDGPGFEVHDCGPLEYWAALSAGSHRKDESVNEQQQGERFNLGLLLLYTGAMRIAHRSSSIAIQR